MSHWQRDQKQSSRALHLWPALVLSVPGKTLMTCVFFFFVFLNKDESKNVFK